MYETPSDVIRMARDIAGKDADQETCDWTAQHITSNNEAVQQGRHDTIYYPGSGRDSIRALIAYDACHLIAVEYNKDYTIPLEDFGDFNIQELATNDPTRRELVFTYNGIERRITEIVGDARLVDPGKIAGRKPDILHIYTPTMGPDDKLGDRAVLSSIVSGITEENYRLIVEGGFFIFNDASISNSPAWTHANKELATLYGLDEIRTVKRNPYTRMLTLKFPNTEMGYIYKKREEVSSEIFAAADEARSLMMMYDYIIGSLRHGETARIFQDPLDDYVANIQELLDGERAQADVVVEECEAAGIPQEECIRFREALEQDVTERLDAIFISYGEFLAVLGDKKSGPVHEEDLKQFGFECLDLPEQASDYQNSRWPFAMRFLQTRRVGDEGYELWWDSEGEKTQRLLSDMKKMSSIRLSS
ncbi:MAG: hypothetical protein Q8P56_03140 [Candidatus Uhrbacteria bacterium]|nr:hypothetical protein [Candidatus Uhrbacteria bacterium]